MIHSNRYQNITQNTLKCKLERAEIGLYNASILVNGEFGRSVTSSNMFLISADDKPYNYLSYARM